MLEKVKEHLLIGAPAPSIRQKHLTEMRERIISRSDLLDGPNFKRVSDRLLAELFDEYDQRFFSGVCRELLQVEGKPLSFSFSKRMTKAGGKTTRRERIEGGKRRSVLSYEITLSATLLFQTFREPGATARVSGLTCHDRLDAVLRIMEHEMVHLLEMLVWWDSNCAANRFQGIANRFFDHREHTHQLTTAYEEAANKYGIRPGDWVSFTYEGNRYKGKVNRVTRRATILVPDSTGILYSDGGRYKKYYVPVQLLKKSG